ncbi:WD40-repeat-containing domain protein [Epithele typhae]|uniref:WD40-repeat-containing domain protein n=1 Tax=Epithele typhae TaxID=378194 RepID=UPI0020086DBC|nr:WD40-repeat-containing domain protein [Epithele typhae]KAH9943061.1 WD40-repeat-containing domain protein [Epithele typhae]
MRGCFDLVELVVGRTGDVGQVSLVRLQGKKLVEIGCYKNTPQGDRKSGISVICAAWQPRSFFTGGYDHSISLWSSADGEAPAPTLLAIKHSSAVHALLPTQDGGHKLLSGSADCSVSVFDIPSGRVTNALKLSNTIYQLHATESPFCTLLEIGHREFQFEVRDHRLAPVQPVLRFGYPSVKVHGRFTRGAVQGHRFACGGSEKDGTVRVWDLRNTSEIQRAIPCFPGRKATQAEFDRERLLVCSDDNQLAFWQTV